jgi:uncharacterized OsmC-like protein
MQISASINSTLNENVVAVQTNDTIQTVALPAKATGFGSSVNGGELLMLSLAVCFCNDLYREAKKRNLVLTKVEVVVSGEFGSEGEPGKNFQYKTNIASDADEKEIQDLIRHTDTVAEIHNTLRRGMNITLRH